jgi:hypothetical protein
VKARSGLWVFFHSFLRLATLFVAFLLLMPLLIGGYGGVYPAAHVELIYGVAFALPVSVLVWARIYVSRGAHGRIIRQAMSVVIAIAGFACVIFLLIVRDHLPDTGWNALPGPPTALESLVRTSPVTALDGVVFGATGDGKVLGLFCGVGDRCEWEAVKNLPPPPDLASFWQGVCDPLGGQSLLWLEPPAPRRVIDRFNTLNCGPGYAIETHFLLTEGGTVWSLQKWNGLDESILLLLRVPMAIVITILGALWTEQLARRAHVIAEDQPLDARPCARRP